MKTSSAIRFLQILVVVLCVTVAAVPARAQESNDFFTVSGIVRDAQSRRPLSGVGVSVPDTRVGTVTNTDGTFSLKIRSGSGTREIEFSLLGYRLRRLAVTGADMPDVVVALSAGPIVLPDVTVVSEEARGLVEEAIRRIGANYSDRTSLLTGFHRETVQKRSSYVDIAEAVVEFYRTPYSESPEGDRLRIVKGRRLVSPRGDTLAVKLQGGPHAYLMGDVVRNRELLLDFTTLDYYRFRLETPVVIDDRPHYAIYFEPAVSFPDYALLEGWLYIDRSSLTISRAEYALDMNDPGKVSAMILRRKPATLRFQPHEVSYVLNYQQRGGRSYLYYIGVKFRFRCDWRRRLFATNYTVLAETVITDGRDDDVVPIPFRESFRSNQSLTDRVGDFYGPEFWEDYNIIAPTESLEGAVNRLKRRRE